ncbi:MAG: hypothetical protein RLZZ543_2189, partial [Bacteroidota bacterium]
MKKCFYLFSCVVLMFISACEREIDIELPDAEDLIVVEGSIEPGQSPVVMLTRNRGFFDSFPSDLEGFINEFVIQDAVVIVSDGQTSEQLNFTVNP